MRARFLPLLACLVLLANAGPAGARDFLIRALEIPAGVDPFDSGNWIDTDVTPDGRLHVGYAQQVENTPYPYQTVYVGPDGAVVVDESVATPFGFVNVDATPSGRLGIGYQAGVTGFPGDLFRTALPPQWDPVQPILPIVDEAATHIAVDRADTYQQVAYFDGHYSDAGFADLRWARPAVPTYFSQFVDEVYLRHRRGRQIDIQVDQFDEPRIAYFRSDHSLRYAYRSGSTWSVEEVTVMLGQGLGHVDLALDGAGRPHVSFYRIDSQDLMYAFRDDDGTWSVDLAAFNGRVGTWNSIAIDPAGVPHISAYRDSDRNVVLVTPAPGDTWSTEVIDPFGGVGESNSIAIDAYGGIHVVYRGRGNGRPLYAWWMDWNVNGVHDATDIANGLLTDCDGNEIPDEAELLFGFAEDCDQDGVIDRCQTDCDGNGINDACQIAADPSDDCDGNGTLDTCDITAGALDCDVNGILDRCQIAADTSLDCDVNGLLDGCEIVSGEGDCNLDGILDACQVDEVATFPGTTSLFFEPSNRAGEFVGGGDLNGDGHVDLVFNEREQVLVHLGGPDFDGVADFALDTRQDALFVGDVDGDGLDDLLVTKYPQTFGDTEVTLYRGDATAVLVQDVTIVSPEGDVDFGIAFALADVDGDGSRDLLVGAPESGRLSAQSYVFVYATDPLDGTPEQIWTPGELNSDGFGRSLVNAGDLDGDGLDDVVVGEPNQSGQAFVFFSRVGSAPASGPVINPTDTLTGFATALAPAGDVDGDGYADFYVGDPSHGATGRVVLYHGGDPMDGFRDRTYVGRTYGASMGASLATGGDLNGDGFDDLLIGSTVQSFGERGVVEVHLGGPQSDTTADLRLSDAEIEGGVGGSVTVLGDVDDDGVVDFAYGAPFEDGDGVVRVRSLPELLFADCNGNGTRDACDIAGGAADDDLDGIPDTCQQTATSVASSTPLVTRLVGAVPTPFNPRTSIVFELARPGPVDLTVFDARGRQVDTLVGGSMSAGRHELVWDARDRASGVYFAVLRADDVVARTKLVLLR